MSEVHIEKMMFGGQAFSRIDGKACFVSFGAPGDVAEVAVRSAKKSYIEAGITRLVKASADRVEPPCPLFGECGGCSWQHLSYDAQLREKEALFREALFRTARVEGDVVAPIVPAPDPWRYRSRVQLKIHHGPEKTHVGFYRTGSHFVTDLPESCLLASPPVQKTIDEVRAVIPFFPDPSKLPQIDIACGEHGGGTLIFHYIGHRRADVCDFLSSVASQFTVVDGVFVQSGRKESLLHIKGSAGYEYGVSRPAGLSEFRLSVSAGGFSQVNFAQNRNMASALVEMVQPKSTDRILDLYCGNGNLSLPLASCAGEVVGIEAYEPSIRDAQANAAANAVTNASFIAADAAKGVRQATSGGRGFDIVVLDPPRGGAADAVPVIVSLAPKKIAYVSCDPMTLARDLAALKKAGYIVRRSLPLDMFPQTYHIESITLLTRT